MVDATREYAPRDGGGAEESKGGVAEGADGGADVRRLTLPTLPQLVLAPILASFLEPGDAARCCCVSRGMRAVASSDAVWELKADRVRRLTRPYDTTRCYKPSTTGSRLSRRFAATA